MYDCNLTPAGANQDHRTGWKYVSSTWVSQKLCVAAESRSEDDLIVHEQVDCSSGISLQSSANEPSPPIKEAFIVLWVPQSSVYPLPFHIQRLATLTRPLCGTRTYCFLRTSCRRPQSVLSKFEEKKKCELPSPLTSFNVKCWSLWGWSSTGRSRNQTGLAELR